VKYKPPDDYIVYRCKIDLYEEFYFNVLEKIAFYKSEPYSYEEEFRVVIYYESQQKGLSVKADLCKAIRNIHLSPFMPIWFKEIVKDFSTYFVNIDTEKGKEFIRKLSILERLKDSTHIKE
jgi:hypothetical protein